MESFFHIKMEMTHENLQIYFWIWLLKTLQAHALVHPETIQRFPMWSTFEEVESVAFATLSKDQPLAWFMSHELLTRLIYSYK